LALRENKIYINGKPHLPTASTRVFFDVEGVPDRGSYYLIGVLIDSEVGQRTHSFWADDQQQQGAMLANFVRLLGGYSTYALYHFGNYDTEALRRLKPQIASDLHAALADIEKRATNVLSVIHSQIYFPVFANTLKNIAGYLGFRWTHEGATGLHSIAWRDQWDRTRDVSSKDRLIRYNLDDCYALKVVADFITSFEERAGGEAALGTGGQPRHVFHYCGHRQSLSGMVATRRIPV
jgi:predicted RecB family nuclease